MNPWEEVCLSDYEKHMSLDSVKQLQVLSKGLWRGYKCSLS